MLAASFAVSTAFAQSKKYAGKELVISADAGVVGTMIQKYGPEFEKLTGCKITWVGIPMDAIYSKTMIELKTGSGAYDIIGIKPFYGGDIMGAGYVLELDKYIDQSGDWWNDIMPAFRERSNKWGDKIMAIQFDGDLHALFYRKDLFEHPDERAAFKKKYGYELDAKNMTWDQYLDIAEFFTRNKGEKLAGETITRPFYGSIEMCQRWGVFWWFLNRFTAYAGPDPHFFDPDTMSPRINSPAGVKALTNMVKAMDYSPPGSLGYAYEEFLDAFLKGRVAMQVMWPDIGRMGEDQKTSDVVGKIGYALNPGAIVDGKLNRRPMLAHGWSLAIPKTCEIPEVAMDFIKWFAGPETLLTVNLDTEGGLDPIRYSVIKSETFREAFVDADKYLDNHMRSAEVAWPDLKIPGSEEYYDTLAVNIGKALTKEMSPKEALDACAREWEKITERRGMQTQLQLYRESMGL